MSSGAINFDDSSSSFFILFVSWSELTQETEHYSQIDLPSNSFLSHSKLFDWCSKLWRHFWNKNKIDIAFLKSWAEHSGKYLLCWSLWTAIFCLTDAVPHTTLVLCWCCNWCSFRAIEPRSRRMHRVFTARRSSSAQCSPSGVTLSHDYMLATILPRILGKGGGFLAVTPIEFSRETFCICRKVERRKHNSRTSNDVCIDFIAIPYF